MSDPLEAAAGALADVDGPLVGGLAELADHLVADSFTSAGNPLPCGASAYITFESATSTFETEPNVLADKLGGQFGAGLLDVLCPAHVHGLGELVIGGLEDLPQGAVGCVGDKDDGVNFPVISLLLRFLLGNTTLPFLQSPLLGQGQAYFGLGRLRKVSFPLLGEPGALLADPTVVPLPGSIIHVAVEAASILIGFPELFMEAFIGRNNSLPAF